MGWQAVALSVTQIAAVIALGVFLWQVFNRRLDGVDARFDRVVADMDVKFGKVDARFDSLVTKVDDLARDHQNLARELSEFRGEIRGRLDALPRFPDDP